MHMLESNKPNKNILTKFKQSIPIIKNKMIKILLNSKMSKRTFCHEMMSLE